MNRVADDRRLPAWRLLLFSAPALPMAALGLPIAAYLPPFYTQTLGFDLAVLGAVFMAARIWDLVTDPLMGVLSDRTRSRFGRRKPWLVGAMPILAVCVYLMFFPAGPVGPLYLGLVLFGTYAGFTMLTIPHLAWAGDLTDAYHERSRIQGAILMVSIVGSFLALTLPAVVEGAAADPARARVEAMGAFFLVLLLPSVAAALWAAPEPTRAHIEQPPSLKDALATLRRHPFFARLVIADFVQGIAGGLLVGLFVFFAERYLELGERASLLLLIFFTSGIVFVPLWIKVSYRLGKHRTIALSSLFTIPFIASLFFVPKGAFWFAALAQIGFGSTMGVWIFLMRSIVADFVDIEEAETGQRQTAFFFALVTLSTKFGQALAVGVGYWALGALGFDPAAEEVAPDLALTVAAMTLGPPIVGHLVMAISLWGFPYGEAAQSRMRAQIAARGTERA